MNLCNKHRYFSYLCSMAKVTYNGVIDDLSGKLGKNVHTHNKTSKYLRGLSENEYVQTDGRKGSNDKFADTTVKWGTLSDKQIDGWNRAAMDYNLKSAKRNNVMKTGRSFFNHVNRNLQEIEEPQIATAPDRIRPQFILDFGFEFVKKGKKKDIIVKFDPKIDDNTKIIIYATNSLMRGQHFVDNGWYKKIAVIDSEFMSGNSILAQYLRVFNDIEENMYKIQFKYREIHKKTGLANPKRVYKMYSDTEND